MYSLINPKPSTLKLLNLPTTTGVPEFPPIYATDGTTVVPYMLEQTLRITATITCQKNYYDTACNIYHAVYDMLDANVNYAFKVAPPTTPPTIGWNALMLLNDIFNQMMKTYGHPMPDAMRQNIMTFLSPYNPQDLPEILFKRCANCQEVAIIANIKYSDKQLLMNIIDLLTRCGLYQRGLKKLGLQAQRQQNVAQFTPVHPGGLSASPCLGYNDSRAGRLCILQPLCTFPSQQRNGR
jgi:hypothetical protein